MELLMSKQTKTKRTVIRWTKRVVLIAAALGIVAAIVRSLLPEVVVVDTAVVTRGPLDVEIREDGQTRVRDRFVVAASITGELERVTLEAGAWVDPSAVVAYIAPPRSALLDDRTRAETTARIAVARARERRAASSIARAREAQALAASEAARTRMLFAKQAVTGSERDRANTAETIAVEDLAAAQHERAAATAEVQSLRAILDPRATPSKPLEVRAPARGRVLRVLRESGGPVTAGTPLLEIGDPASLDVVIDVLSRDAERVAPGMTVEIETAENEMRRGTVVLVEPAAFTQISALGVEEQRVNVVVCFDGPASIGYAFRIEARIITWHGDDVVQVPASALFRDRGRWAVYTLAEGRARQRMVEVGHRGRVTVEITRGLVADERVIIHPSDRIHADTRVKNRQ
jgi:HlyD family secretion protein